MAKHNAGSGWPIGESSSKDTAWQQQTGKGKDHAGGTRCASGQAWANGLKLMVCRKNEQSAVTQRFAAAAVD